MPKTYSFLHDLIHTFSRSALTRWTFLSLIAQPILFFLLRRHSTFRSILFLVYFAFWRGSYDIGFAWALRKQSEKRWIVKLLKGWGWLEEDGVNQWSSYWKRELEMKMGQAYRWEAAPPEFNTWLIFRQLVDVVLLKSVKLSLTVSFDS